MSNPMIPLPRSASAPVAFHGIAAGELPAPERPASRSVKERFAGTWKLLSWKIEQDNGELADPAWGPDPVGWIMYHLTLLGEAQVHRLVWERLR